MNTKFLQPNGPAAQFFRPSLLETYWTPIHSIRKVDRLSHGSTGRSYCFDCDEMEKNGCDLFDIHLQLSYEKTNKNESANKYTLQHRC